MSGVRRLTAVVERVLSERTFSLIVAPALADLEFERGGRATLLQSGSVMLAVAIAVYEDLTSDLGAVLSFAGMALMPAGYYAVLFSLCLPRLDWRGLDSVSLGFLALVLVLSSLPTVACCWPLPGPRRRADREGCGDAV